MNIHYIAKSIGTPSNERLDYFSNLHEYKSYVEAYNDILGNLMLYQQFGLFSIVT